MLNFNNIAKITDTYTMPLKQKKVNNLGETQRRPTLLTRLVLFKGKERMVSPK